MQILWVPFKNYCVFCAFSTSQYFAHFPFTPSTNYFVFCACSWGSLQEILHKIIAVEGLEEIHRSHNNSCGESLGQVYMENAQNTHSHLQGLQGKRAKNYTIRLCAGSARKCMQQAQILPEENKWSLKRHYSCPVAKRKPSLEPFNFITAFTS